MSSVPWWAAEDFWRKCAIFVTAFSVNVITVIASSSIYS